MGLDKSIEIIYVNGEDKTPVEKLTNLVNRQKVAELRLLVDPDDGIDTPVVKSKETNSPIPRPTLIIYNKVELRIITPSKIKTRYSITMEA